MTSNDNPKTHESTSTANLQTKMSIFKGKLFLLKKSAKILPSWKKLALYNLWDDFKSMGVLPEPIFNPMRVLSKLIFNQT